jgi:hypothetical protein
MAVYVAAYFVSMRMSEAIADAQAGAREGVAGSIPAAGTQQVPSERREDGRQAS